MRQFQSVSKTALIVAASVWALAACSEQEDQASGSSPAMEAVAEGAPAEMTASDAAAGGELAPLADRAEIPVTTPSIAYVFDTAFRLPGDEIAPLQMRHADMCDELGPAQCQIIGMANSGGEENADASGRLELAVASDRARGFVSELSSLAASFHGEQVSSQITGEDLSKSLVDTEARLRSRMELRDRLMDVLQTRRGTVAELVEAERSVAAINEEIDAARSWMAEMQGRVSFSRVVLTYQTATPLGADFLAPVRGALGSVGSILGLMLAIAIVIGAVGLPLAGAIIGTRWLRRRWAVKAVVEA